MINGSFQSRNVYDTFSANSLETKVECVYQLCIDGKPPCSSSLINMSQQEETEPSREEQRTMYAKYTACCDHARAAVLESKEYTSKLKAAEAQSKGIYRRLQHLRKEVEAQIDDTCAQSLKPVQKLCNIACQTELDNYWKAMECLREAWRNRAEEPIDFQRVLLLKAQTSPAREQFHQCSHNFFAKLRSET